MPKNPVDYSKTLIYKIVCKNPDIEGIYVGHTTDLKSRKNCHKTRCNCQTQKFHNLYVYEYIRNNGGWDNWDMLVIEEYPCENMYEACLRERHWLETLHANLNTTIPSRSKKERKKTYNELHKDEIREYRKEYREANKEIISQKAKEYSKKNRDKINENKRKNYHKNKEKILEKIVCECGAEISRGSLSRHCKRTQHLQYLESIN